MVMGNSMLEGPQYNARFEGKTRQEKCPTSEPLVATRGSALGIARSGVVIHGLTFLSGASDGLFDFGHCEHVPVADLAHVKPSRAIDVEPDGMHGGVGKDALHG